MRILLLVLLFLTTPASADGYALYPYSMGAAPDELAAEKPDTFARVFKAVTAHPSPRQKAVVDGMDNRISLGKMISDGRIASPYDCLPELRADCYDAMHAPADDWTIDEWGEWYDAYSDDELPAFVADLMDAAAKRGFNLFTNEELQTYATTNVKVWADDACAIVVKSEEDGFRVTRDTSEGPVEAVCRIESWPISSPIAVLACDDGSKPEVQFVEGGDTMAFEDMILRVPTDENGVCE